MKDLLGRPMTPAEKKILSAYRAVSTLLFDPDLPPTAVANLKEAQAALWQVVNNLALRFERPGEERA